MGGWLGGFEDGFEEGCGRGCRHGMGDVDMDVVWEAVLGQYVRAT